MNRPFKYRAKLYLKLWYYRYILFFRYSEVKVIEYGRGKPYHKFAISLRKR